MKINHIGYAVHNIENAKKEMESLGFTFEKVVKDTDRNIYICFGENAGYHVELVAPISKGSSIDVLLTKIGPTPYHFCFSSKNIEEDIVCLEKKRFKVIMPLAPAIAFGRKRVAFLYSLQAGLIEIVEE